MVFWRTVMGLWAAGNLLLAGCARPIAPTAPGPLSEPRVSWVLRSGPPDGRESEVCRSDQQMPCVLQASTASRPMTVAVSLYMYAAGVPTKYSGALQSSFIEGAGGRGYETKVDYSIAPGELPTAVTTAGRVTSNPGEHAFRIALLADVPAHMDPHQFERTVSVRVAPAQTSANVHERDQRLPMRRDAVTVRGGATTPMTSS